MKKGPGFVYPAGGARSRSAAQPKRESERLRLQFESVSSPRKRKRSPDAPPEPSSVTATDQTQSIPAEQPRDYDANDSLDELCKEALEDYELTQSAVTTHTPSGASRWFGTSTTGALPTCTTSALKTDSASIPPVKTTQATSQQEELSSQAGGEKAHTSSSEKGHTMVSSSKHRQKVVEGEEDCETDSDVHLLRSELSEKFDRLQELEEKGYERDGEVKLLRGELRKKEDQLRELHTRIASEQKLKEEQFARETKSLSTQLEFKEQELAALRERCSSLEQRHKQHPSVIHTSPIPHSSRMVPKHTPGEGGTGRSSQKGNSKFLSTENFMPLSQMTSSDITPVHVAHVPKRGLQQMGGSGTSVSPEVSGVKVVTTARRPSPAQSHPPVTTRGKSTDRPIPVAEQSSGPPNRSKQTTSQRSSHSCTPISGGKAAPSVHDHPLHLSVPPLEVASGELLMLLAQQDLLKLPSFEENSESEATSDGVDESSNIQTLLQSSCSSLPGLFSLLHIPHFSSRSASTSSATTPVSRLQPMTPPSAGTSMSNPLSDLSSDSFPRTPVRKSRLQLHSKPHTCGRTDMSRSRTRTALDDFPLRKALSASNTPVRESAPSTPGENEQQQISQSLLSSIDVESLTGSILSMLRQRDSSTVQSMLNQTDRNRSATSFSLLSFSPSLAQQSHGGRGGDGPSVEIQILLDLGDIVQRYVAEQMERARASAMSANSNTSYISDPDSFDTQSPRSSVGSSSASSRNSSELNQPSQADQSFVYRSLSVLETLLTYSRQAREHLTAPLPPKCAFEEEMASRFAGVDGEGKKKGEEERMEEGEEEGENSESTDEMKTPTILREIKPQTVVWKGNVLEQFGTGPFSRVWVPHLEQQPQSESLSAGSLRRRSTSVPLSVTPYERGQWGGGVRGRRRESDSGGRRGRQLFSSLLRLVSPHWKECNEVILLCLKLLCILAHDCPQEQLERFSVLLDRDGLDTFLVEDTPDPSLCLTSLTLLTHLTNSPHLTRRLCSQGVTSEGCLLQICYEFFTRPVTEDKRMTRAIHVQLVRLVSNISVVAGGPAILFESPCHCCAELLKSVMALIQTLVQDAYSSDDLSHSSTMLLCSLITLLHMISLCDRYFDSRRETCKYAFAYSLRTLKLLFADSDTVNTTTKYILSELYLEYCEEDQADNSSCEDSETQMTE